MRDGRQGHDISAYKASKGFVVHVHMLWKLPKTCAYPGARSATPSSTLEKQAD